MEAGSDSDDSSDHESTVVLMFYDKNGNLRDSEEQTTITISQSASTYDSTAGSSESSSWNGIPNRCRILDRLKQKKQQEREQHFREMLADKEEEQQQLQEEVQARGNREDNDSVSTSSSNRRRRSRRKQQQRNNELMAMNEFAGFSPRSSSSSKNKKKASGSGKLNPLQMFRKKSDHDSVQGVARSTASGSASISSCRSIRSGYSRSSMKSRSSWSSLSSRRSHQPQQSSGRSRNNGDEPVSILRRTLSMSDVKKSATTTATSQQQQQLSPTAAASGGGGVRFAEGTVFVEPKTRKKVPRLNPTGRSGSPLRRRRPLGDRRTTPRAPTPRHAKQVNTIARHQPSLETAISVLSLDGGSDDSLYSVMQNCNPNSIVDDMVPLLSKGSGMDCYVFR